MDEPVLTAQFTFFREGMQRFSREVKIETDGILWVVIEIPAKDQKKNPTASGLFRIMTPEFIYYFINTILPVAVRSPAVSR
jgi:hypothetical protein